MGLRMEIALIFIISLGWIQYTLCDGNSEANKWICDCYIETYSSVSAYCMSSCTCNIVDRTMWTCICPVDGVPRLAREVNDDSCFENCDCHAGKSERTSKEMPFKFLFLILFLMLFVFVVIQTFCSLFFLKVTGDVPP